MSDTDACADALDTAQLLADLTAVPHHDDRPEPLTPEQCAIIDIRSANAVPGRCWDQSHERAIHARDGREGVEMAEVGSHPRAIMPDCAVEDPRGLAKTRADMESAVASGVVVPLRKATDITALRDDGEAEALCQRWMRRSERAWWISNDYQDRVEFENSCLWTEDGNAACELISIREALNFFRSDAWGHLADSYRRRAEGLQPDPDRIADLRYCRVRIAELNAQYRAAEAAAKAEAEAPESEGQFNDVAADASPNIRVLRFRHAEAYASSAHGAVALSAMPGDDDVPW
jgi:hypothetical protein